MIQHLSLIKNNYKLSFAKKLLKRKNNSRISKARNGSKIKCLDHEAQ